MSAQITHPSPEIGAAMGAIGRAAVAAAAVLAQANSATKNCALHAAAEAVRRHVALILSANEIDLRSAKERALSVAMLDRLKLDADRVEAIARGIDAVAELLDPIGTVIADWSRPNGMRIQRVRVPLGVIGIIYESRPNVTADAGTL